MSDLLHREVKAQPVRLFDVVLLAPFMVVSGMKLRQSGSPEMGAAMVIAGAGTFAYNLGNYARIDRERRRQWQR